MESSKDSFVQACIVSIKMTGYKSCPLQLCLALENHPQKADLLSKKKFDDCAHHNMILMCELIDKMSEEFGLDSVLDAEILNEYAESFIRIHHQTCR